MKWKNKGHEFDELGKIFNFHMKVWIYGGGQNGRDLFRRMGFADCVEGFIDNGLEAHELYGKNVVSVIDFMNLDYKNTIVVVCADRENEIFMLNQMRQLRFEEGKTLFEYNGFLHFWLPIFAMYSWNKLYLHGVAFLTTTYCNLNCKYCLEFTAQNDQKKRFEISSLKKSLDLAFKSIDFMGLLNIAGGEAFLFQDDLEEILDYIGQYYRKKIGVLYVTTNGTILPSDSLCRTMKNAGVFLQIDDYTGRIKTSKILINDIIKKCKDFCVRYSVNRVHEWLDLGLGEVDNSKYTDDELCNYYIACQQEWMELYDGKLSNCNYNSYAVRAGLMNEHSEEIYDLCCHAEKDRMTLFEYSRGYSQKGYFEMCKQCRGYWGINRKHVEVAEQVKQST